MKRVHHILAAGVLAAGFVAFFASTSAQAALESGKPHYFLQTGSDLEKACANPVNAKAITAEERERLLICGSYIQGFLAHYGLVRQEIKSASFCLPSGGISGEKVRALFLVLLQQKPQIRDLPASVDLATSLAWGYSCAQATGANTSGADKSKRSKTGAH